MSQSSTHINRKDDDCYLLLENCFFNCLWWLMFMSFVYDDNTLWKILFGHVIYIYIYHPLGTQFLTIHINHLISDP